jgi:protein subunit release factor A
VIEEDDLEVEVRRAPRHDPLDPATHDPAVRVTHIPTGIVVVSEATESQVANKAAAIEELERLLAARESEIEGLEQRLLHRARAAAR